MQTHFIHVYKYETYLSKSVTDIFHKMSFYTEFSENKIMKDRERERERERERGRGRERRKRICTSENGV